MQITNKLFQVSIFRKYWERIHPELGVTNMTSKSSLNLSYPMEGVDVTIPLVIKRNSLNFNNIKN